MAISTNNKRIAKNTLYLYFRMLLIMVVNLFSVRILLKILGVEDYGIYNVVGGIVVMFSFLSGTLASASQRFLSFELGRNNILKLKQIFSLTLLSYFFLAIVIMILSETVGLYLLNEELNLPPDRMGAANWIYQFSILAFIVTIITTPYQAVIIAREKMAIYAYISLLDSVLKLFVIFFLYTLTSLDKLKIYSILTFGVTLVICLIYQFYCRRKFTECKFCFYWNWDDLSRILAFAWWNMVGAIAHILRNQGINILLNIFFNPAINTARAIAYQVNAAITSFTDNFYTAVRPQIIKTYSVGDMSGMHTLILSSSKFSFFLMMILTIPLLFETNYILGLWLDTVPEYTVLFCRLVMLNAMIDIFNAPLVNAMQATGRIREYQLSVNILALSNLPIAYLFLRNGFLPQITMIISIVISIISFVPRLYLAHKVANISIKQFCSKVLLIVYPVFVLSGLFPFFLSKMMDESFYRFLIIGMSTVFFSLFFIYVVGLTKHEKNFVVCVIRKKFHVYKK